MNKKNIVIMILALCLLVSIFYINHLMNEVWDKHMEGVDRYNELSKEKSRDQDCFLDRLMQIELCVINCHDDGCYKRCGIKTMYNNFVQECVN